jgi:1,2-diacylglycerol 3-beta-galactosyltransferase
MVDRKKVLILTADAGFGHRSAANAVAAAIEEKFAEDTIVEIVNPLDDQRMPTFLRDSQSDYTKWVRNVPELYQLGYEASDSLLPNTLLENSLVVLMIDAMRGILEESQPDVVLITYPLYQSTLTALFRSRRYKVPLYTSITDLSTVHRMWFHKRVDGCLVPNSLVADLATSCGIAPAKITITGIPVHPNVVRETRTRNEVRQDLGWAPDVPTILAVGSKRVERLVDTLNIINHYGGKIQLAIVAGKDERLLQEINQFEWHIPAYIYDFVENMPELMHAADLIICKAGGLIVTESLACGLPMILIDIIPGQETGNAEYVTALGAADLAETPIAVLENIDHLLMNDQLLLRQRARNAAKIGLPNSAYKVATILHQALEKAANQPPKTRRHVHNDENNLAFDPKTDDPRTWLP